MSRHNLYSIKFTCEASLLVMDNKNLRIVIYLYMEAGNISFGQSLYDNIINICI